MTCSVARHDGKIVRIGRDTREQLTSANRRLLSRSLRLATEFAVEAARLAELDGVPPDRAAG
jgi:hypothetical protein